ncbi:MAG TPA: hypothetical protein VJO53_11435 [Candidatus Acidoferrales bacterium]|nr:hypothetical protein [Candidatus Acidoferrales bacterium]
MELPEEKIREIIVRVSAYFRREREHYLPSSIPLTQSQKELVQSYFSGALLDAVRLLTLKGARIGNPPFFDDVKALGFTSFPEFKHLSSFTYIDVIVFHEQIAPRTLFHGLVHAAQFALLGVDHYVDMYVRGFVKSGLWIAIPLEEHAFKSEARFALSRPEVFSMEAEIRLWELQGRYR